MPRKARWVKQQTGGAMTTVSHKTTNIDHRSTTSYAWDEAWGLLSMLLGYLVICAIFLVLLATQARADETMAEIEHLDDVSQGSLLFQNPHGRYLQAPSLNTDVAIHVSGMIVRAKVRQAFKNNSDAWVEGIYVFPLPEDAAVDHMRMQIGERVIEGQIKEREEAKRTYDQARQAGKKSALIEQERPNLFTNSVANIGPHETVTIEIEYQQLLRYEAGQFRLRFPLTITPRYIPGQPIQQEENVSQFNGLGWSVNTNQVPDASRITPPLWQGEGKLNPVSLVIELNAGFPLTELKSPYHAIQTSAHKAIHTITLANEQNYADRDFELSWTPEAAHAPRAALFTEEMGAELYHLLMVLPPQPEQNKTQRLPREVIYIIDTSGSMSGISIQQARQALLLALDRLQPEDTFNVIAFNSSINLLFGQALPASNHNLDAARRYVNTLRANGGTNIRPALEAALNIQNESAALRQVVFLTDGSVGNEAELFSMIHQRLGQSRLFTVGIGSAPNSHFMHKAAQFGRGSFTYIGDVNEVQSKMKALFQKLETPLMRELQADFGNAEAEVYPKRLPDLYAGEPLIISTKTNLNTHTIIISGKRQQSTWQNSIQLDQGMKGRGIGTLWARRKIADLMDQQHEGANKEIIKQQIIATALQHHLVSKHTSLVAVDATPSRPESEAIEQQAMPVNLPHGQVHEKIFGLRPRTATAAPLHLTLGALFLLLTLLLKPRRTIEGA